MRALQAVPVKTEYTAFNGGLDTTSPPLNVLPGFCRKAQNYEQDLNGGYRRIDGYERFDGRAAPSSYSYYILNCTITGPVAVGDTVTDDAGTSTAKVLAIGIGHLALARVVGAWPAGNIKDTISSVALENGDNFLLENSDELMLEGGSVIGTFTSPPSAGTASSVMLDAQYLNLAADEYRSDIGVVPGSGNVLGVWVYNDDVYAFRNNAGGTAAVMHKATTGGWTAVSLGEEIEITNANASVGEGDTLTQGGVTATIKRVVIETGSLNSGVNTGRLIISGRSGGNFAAGAATSTGGGSVTLGGAQTAIAFAVPTGRFEFVNGNFGGSGGTFRMYGCDGKNRAFEFDGTVFTPIRTGMALDAPEHIAIHQNQLFLSFGASLQHSAPGEPYSWNAIIGAGELAVGENITGLTTQPGAEGGGALSILSRNATFTLYGTGVTDWKLVSFKNEAGAYEHTTQKISGRTVIFDERGICDLATSQNYGNFEDATLSIQVKNDLTVKNSLTSASTIIREKNQYRLFFTDKTGYYMTMAAGKVIGIMPVFYAHAVRCACSAEKSDGEEVAFFGSTDGYVYQFDKGTSFDGSQIEAYIYLAFAFSGAPRVRKRFRQAMFEVKGEGYSEMNFSYELNYGGTSLIQPSSVNLPIELGASFWDSFVWDAFYWDGKPILPIEADMTGTGENYSIIIISNSDYFKPHKISGVIVHYSDRRQLR